jgi:hypothetical protein
MWEYISESHSYLQQITISRSQFLAFVGGLFYPRKDLTAHQFCTFALIQIVMDDYIYFAPKVIKQKDSFLWESEISKWISQTRLQLVDSHNVLELSNNNIKAVLPKLLAS